MACDTTSALCNPLWTAAERARADWINKHQAACKNLPAGQHANDCNVAYAYYLQKNADWVRSCCKGLEQASLDEATLLRIMEETRGI